MRLLSNSYSNFHDYRSLYTAPSDYEKVLKAINCVGTLTFKNAWTNKPFFIVDLKFTNAKKADILMLHGEHARELISTEFALHYIKHLCKDPATETADRSLARQNNYRFIIDANPLQRQLILDWMNLDKICVRTNADGIDLNRHWSSHWKYDKSDPDTYTGERNMTAFEVQTINQWAFSNDPDVFVSVHSGRWYLGFDDLSTINDAQKPTFEGEKKILFDSEMVSSDTKSVKFVAEEQCDRVGQCSNEKKMVVGELSAALAMNYEVHGSCTDYARSVKKVPLVFAAEIYEGPRTTCGTIYAPVTQTELTEVLNMWTGIFDRFFATIATQKTILYDIPPKESNPNTIPTNTEEIQIEPANEIPTTQQMNGSVEHVNQRANSKRNRNQKTFMEMESASSKMDPSDRIYLSSAWQNSGQESRF